VTRGGIMAFTIEEFRDLIQLLEDHPAWRSELRRWVLSEDLLTLPQRPCVRLPTPSTIPRSAWEQLTARVDQLVEAQSRMGSDLERLKESDLERCYRERAHAYFSRLIRRTHVLSGDELSTLLEEAVTQRQLSEDEADDLLQADAVIRGRRRDDNSDVYLVVEVSWGIGLSDVERAATRAAALTKLGTPALPVVAGFWITPEAQEPARAFKVWQVTNGRVSSPDIA
jgi:hypothetical protein